MLRLAEGVENWSLKHYSSSARIVPATPADQALPPCKKTGINTGPDVLCRMCGKGPESVPHILSGCSTLAQTKYLARHNSALKILFFEMLRDQNLVSKVPPWYSPVQPKPMYENERAKAFWDVPVYAESVMVKANRIDARLVEKERKRVAVIEMSCPWMDNRAIKDAEKTAKYGPLRWELKQQYPGYEVKQFNTIIDVLGDGPLMSKRQ